MRFPSRSGGNEGRSAANRVLALGRKLSRTTHVVPSARDHTQAAHSLPQSLPFSHEVDTNAGIDVGVLSMTGIRVQAL